MAEEDRLKQYMELLEQHTGGLPSEEGLKKLQAQCRLEPGDLKKLDMLVERHNERADIYQHRDNVNGAIEELERACQLSPRDAYQHLNLAKLYKNRYENYGFLRRDRIRSREEAEKTRILDPGLREPAELIEELALIQKSLYGGRRGRRPVTPIILAALLLILIILFSGREAISNWISGILNPPREVIYIPPPRPFDPSLPREIGLESYDFTSRNLEFTLQKSRVIPVNDHWGYELKGGISSPSLAMGEATLELRFLGDGSRIIYSRELSLDEGPLILPGETLPVDLFFFLPFSPRELDRISLTPQSVSLKDPPSYTPRDIRLWWEKEKPEGVKLTLEERESYSLEGYDRNRHFFVFDLSQKGQASLDSLELSFRWKNRAEETVLVHDVTVAGNESPLLGGGEVRAFEFQVGTPFSENWDSLSYDVTVTEIGLASE